VAKNAEDGQTPKVAKPLTIFARGIRTMMETIRATLAELRRTAGRLDVTLAGADPGRLPPLHAARLNVKLADLTRELATLAELTEQLTGPALDPAEGSRTRQARRSGEDG
jgi:hypothetical protein